MLFINAIFMADSDGEGIIRILERIFLICSCSIPFAWIAKTSLEVSITVVAVLVIVIEFITFLLRIIIGAPLNIAKGNLNTILMHESDDKNK